MGKKSEFQFLHSTYTKTENGDGIVALLKNTETNEKELKIVRNPKRSIFITKPGLRETFKEKKEYAPMSEVDEFIVYNHEMFDEIKVRLGFYRKSYIKQKKLLNSPYVYAADIDIEVLMKQHYMNKAKRMASEIHVGGLDIETSVLGGKEIILNTYVSHDHHIYTAVLKPFLKDKTLDDIEKCTTSALQKFRDNLNEAGQKVYDKFFPKVEVKIFDREVDLIIWIFKQIHKHKDDFISVWNMGYDIPYMLERLKILGYSPYQIMCHPDVPGDLRVCNWRPDKSPQDKLGHWSYRWDFFYLSGYSQFIDSMCLYSRLRKVKGIESSYTLKYIANKVLGTSKLDFGEANHSIMQQSRFVEYTAYNIVDTLLLTLMDKVTGDMSSMVMLTKDTDLPSFSKQTVQLKNWFYNYCRGENCVPSACKGDQTKPYDKYIHNVGGGVLNPLLARETGTRRIKENNHLTNLNLMVSDLDVVSMYPHIQIMSNISRETKLSTVLSIEGMPYNAINDFFGHYVAVEENSVHLASKFFNLPNYETVGEMFDNL